MTYFEMIERAEMIKFWTNTVTLGLMRFAIIAACVKYLFWG